MKSNATWPPAKGEDAAFRDVLLAFGAELLGVLASCARTGGVSASGRAPMQLGLIVRCAAIAPTSKHTYTKRSCRAITFCNK